MFNWPSWSASRFNATALTWTNACSYLSNTESYITKSTNTCIPNLFIPLSPTSAVFVQQLYEDPVQLVIKIIKFRVVISYSKLTALWQAHSWVISLKCLIILSSRKSYGNIAVHSLQCIVHVRTTVCRGLVYHTLLVQWPFQHYFQLVTKCRTWV